MVRREKGMADGLVSVKEHEGVGAREQAESTTSLGGKKINIGASVGKIPSLFSVRQEVCWLDRVGRAGLRGSLAIVFWFIQQAFPLLFWL